MAIEQKLVDANPAVADFQRQLEGSRHVVGELLAQKGLPIETLREYRPVAGDPPASGRRQPQRHRLPARLASDQNSIGWLLYKMGRPTEALAAFGPARVTYQALAVSGKAPQPFAARWRTS